MNMPIIFLFGALLGISLCFLFYWLHLQPRWNKKITDYTTKINRFNQQTNNHHIHTMDLLSSIKKQQQELEDYLSDYHRNNTRGELPHSPIAQTTHQLTQEINNGVSNIDRAVKDSAPFLSPLYTNLNESTQGSKLNSKYDSRKFDLKQPEEATHA